MIVVTARGGQGSARRTVEVEAVKPPFEIIDAAFRELARRFPEKQRKAILELCLDAKRLESTPVHEFVDLMVI